LAADDPPEVHPAQEFFRRFQQQPFGNPQEMFDRLFGADSEQERAVLDSIEVSPEEESRLGKQAATAYLDSLKQQRVRLVTQGRDVEYVRALLETLRPQMQQAERYPEFKVVIARSPLTDARTFPGGTIVFHEGLLEFADNEAAVVGILGHELSHLDREHLVVSLKGMKLAEQTFSGQGGVNWSRSGPTLMRLWSRPFRPEDEKHADLDGATWAYRAGYDPREMARLFLRLQERNEQRAGFANFLPGFLRSHPYERDRYDAVMQRTDELQREEPQERALYVGRKNLELRAPRSKQAYPE
jgi:predicted Zn-dependent protease